MSEDDQLLNPALRQVLVVLGKHLIRDQASVPDASLDVLLSMFAAAAAFAGAAPTAAASMPPLLLPLPPQQLCVAVWFQAESQLEPLQLFPSDRAPPYPACEQRTNLPHNKEQTHFASTFQQPLHL